MRLVRFGEAGHERPGALDQSGVLRDLSGVVADIDGSVLNHSKLTELRALDLNALPAVTDNARTGPRLGPCVGSIGKLVCIGLNYSDHAAEVGKSAPSEPVIFLKSPTSICGPTDPIEVPRGSTQTDWEIELGVVVGARAKYVSEADAARHIAGYCVFNDISERAHQTERQGQWTKGKGHDTHGPIGPWLVTADDVPDPQNLRLWCEVDGTMRQDSNTSRMIFNVGFLVAYISQFMTLEPGDVVATGTPSGVGKGAKPAPTYLSPGQRIRCGIDGLGEQDHVMVAA